MTEKKFKIRALYELEVEDGNFIKLNNAESISIPGKCTFHFNDHDTGVATTVELSTIQKENGEEVE